MGEWMSKGPAHGQAPMTQLHLRHERQSTQTAHFLVDGRPVCASLQVMGKPLLAPFKCSWMPLRAWDKKCGLCLRLEEHMKKHRWTTEPNSNGRRTCINEGCFAWIDGTMDDGKPNNCPSPNSCIHGFPACNDCVAHDTMLHMSS